MNQNLRAFVLLVSVIFLGFHQVNACLPNVESFRKTFKNSKNVFWGEIVAVETIKIEELPKEIQARHNNYKVLSQITFRVNKSWKGSNAKQMIVYSTLFCTCPVRYDYFSVGKKYLIFSDKQSYFDACNLINAQTNSTEAEMDSQGTDFVKINIQRLDNFWFRIWARIYPF